MTAALLLALLLSHTPAPVPQAPTAPAPSSLHVDARSSAAANTVEGRIAVKGTVRQLRERLVALERWPGLFADVRSLEHWPSGAWSIDFAAFGHPHDFTATPTSGGLMLTLAQANHGTARLEYSLRPLDAEHVTLSVRFVVPTPPGFTAAKMRAMLRAKAVSDLESFARAASGAAPAITSSQH